MIPKIHLAAPLLAEGSISMNVYADELASAFNRAGGVAYERITPHLPPGGPKWKKLFVRGVRYPLLVRKIARREKGMLHVLDHSYAHLCRHHPRAIVTCHDIAEYRVSQLTGTQFKRWQHRVEGMRSALHVIADSENTAKDVKELLGIPEERVSVVYLGVDSIFRPHSRESALLKFPQLGGPELKILHVGGNIRRKNLPVLIEALGRLKKAGVPFSFVKVGKPFFEDQERLLRENGVDQHLIHLGFCDGQDLPLIYSLCDVFVFPSTYEGFGLPILEAQACGTPVILSDSSCMAEVGREAALYFPANEPEKLVEAILQVRNESVRKDLIAKGLENATHFTWDVHAQRLLEVYHKVADKLFSAKN